MLLSRVNIMISHGGDATCSRDILKRHSTFAHEGIPIPAKALAGRANSKTLTERTSLFRKWLAPAYLSI